MQGVIFRRCAAGFRNRRKRPQEPERARSHSPETNLLGLLAVLSLSISIAGCAGSETTTDAILRRGPLPYDVGIFVESSPRKPPPGGGTGEESGSSEAQAGSQMDQVRFLQSSVEVAQTLQKALLESYPGVSKVKILSASDRREALEAARGLDVLLVAGIALPGEFADYHLSPGWAALEVGCWLFGGIPAWFIPTVAYMTDARVSVEGLDLHQKVVRSWYAALKGARSGEAKEESLPAFDWQETFESAAHNVSLWDRSHPFDHPLDYLCTIVVPPMVFIPGDPARLSRKLTDEITWDWGERLSAGVSGRLLEEEAKKPLSLVFRSPPPKERVLEDSLRLRLYIRSRGAGDEKGAELTGLEVFRFAKETPLFQWRAQKTDLEGLQGDLDALDDKGDYVLWDVPVDIPLEPGPNTIKVRVRRSDGEQVIRTMVYSH